MRAAATESGWSSGTTPQDQARGRLLPIGERRNGICVRSRKARTSSSARDHAIPLPAGLLIGFASENDWLDYRLENDPCFLRRIEHARNSVREGRGIKIEELER